MPSSNGPGELQMFLMFLDFWITGHECYALALSSEYQEIGWNSPETWVLPRWFELVDKHFQVLPLELCFFIYHPLGSNQVYVYSDILCLSNLRTNGAPIPITVGEVFQVRDLNT